MGWHPYVSRDNRDNWLLTDSELGCFSVFNKFGATSTIAVVTAVLHDVYAPLSFSSSSMPLHADWFEYKDLPWYAVCLQLLRWAAMYWLRLFRWYDKASHYDSGGQQQVSLGTRPSFIQSTSRKIVRTQPPPHPQFHPRLSKLNVPACLRTFLERILPTGEWVCSWVTHDEGATLAFFEGVQGPLPYSSVSSTQAISIPRSCCLWSAWRCPMSFSYTG